MYNMQVTYERLICLIRAVIIFMFIVSLIIAICSRYDSVLYTLCPLLYRFMQSREELSLHFVFFIVQTFVFFDVQHKTILIINDVSWS